MVVETGIRLSLVANALTSCPSPKGGGETVFYPRCCPSMSPEELEHLKSQYAGQRVMADARRPELTRLAGLPGRIVTINCNGQALVQFEGADQGWHDIDPEFLKLEPSP